MKLNCLASAKSSTILQNCSINFARQWHDVPPTFKKFKSLAMSLTKATVNQHNPMNRHNVGLNHNCVEMSATNSTVNATKNPIGVFQLNGHLKCRINIKLFKLFFFLACNQRILTCPNNPNKMIHLPNRRKNN